MIREIESESVFAYRKLFFSLVVYRDSDTGATTSALTCENGKRKEWPGRYTLCLISTECARMAGPR